MDRTEVKSHMQISTINLFQLPLSSQSTPRTINTFFPTTDRYRLDYCIPLLIISKVRFYILFSFFQSSLTNYFLSVSNPMMKKIWCNVSECPNILEQASSEHNCTRLLAFVSKFLLLTSFNLFKPWTIPSFMQTTSQCHPCSISIFKDYPLYTITSLASKFSAMPRPQTCLCAYPSWESFCTK